MSLKIYLVVALGLADVRQPMPHALLGQPVSRESELSDAWHDSSEQRQRRVPPDLPVGGVRLASKRDGRAVESGRGPSRRTGSAARRRSASRAPARRAIPARGRMSNQLQGEEVAQVAEEGGAA